MHRTSSASSLFVDGLPERRPSDCFPVLRCAQGRASRGAAGPGGDRACYLEGAQRHRGSGPAAAQAGKGRAGSGHLLRSGPVRLRVAAAVDARPGWLRGDRAGAGATQAGRAACRRAWLATGVAEREEPTETRLGSTARCCGRRRHRQANSVRVCSPTSRRVASLRPRSAGLTALTPAPRTLVQTGSCRRCSLIHPLHVVVDVLSRMTLFRATVDTGPDLSQRRRWRDSPPAARRPAIAKCIN